jgi:hypothetical protein
MPAMLDHLDEVSLFGRSSAALFLVLGFSWVFSAVHSYQEWRGEDVPLWRVFGAVVGVWLPDWIGFLSFTLALTLVLWGVSLAGIGGWLPIIGPMSLPAAVGALGCLIGARISDTLVSHWGLYALGYRPNPGLKSTPLYVIEAVFILVTFRKGLSLAPSAAWVGLACGAGFFVLVLPALAALRVIPSWRRAAWIRWQPIPAWTTD